MSPIRRGQGGIGGIEGREFLVIGFHDMVGVGPIRRAARTKSATWPVVGSTRRDPGCCAQNAHSRFEWRQDETNSLRRLPGSTASNGARARYRELAKSRTAGMRSARSMTG